MSFAKPRSDLSALPLTALPAVALDTETTGLDTARARVVEIAALRLEPGATQPTDTFATLVDPGMPIPPASTAVHGITDEEVAEQPDFAAVMADLAAWVGEAVVIGYAIGFDLAVLKAEHDRRGLRWTAPRSLDTRHLAQLVAPALPDPSLDTVAAWLGVAVHDRHRALGDARAAGEIFQALLPRLRDKGIVTLGQAERASLTLVSRLTEEASAGWHAAAETGNTANSTPLLARIDSYLYRHRVGDVMQVPPVVLDPAVSLRQALATMMRRRISSVFLPPDCADGVHGILTERDILRAINAYAGALDAPASHHATWPLVTVSAEEFLYRAATVMASANFRHLGVLDREGRLVGALSARDLLRQRAGEAAALGDSIERAGSAPELGRIWSGLTTVACALTAEEVAARDIAAIVSRELRALTRRACELAEGDLGAPPVAYAMLVLGSGGRGESLLAMDQDNAIVFAEGEPDSAADRWFAELGGRVADALNEAGVAYCKGGVMARNAEWRHDRAGWRRLIADWLRRTRPEDILTSDIFFDATCVHGDTTMANDLIGEAAALAATARPYLLAMSVNAADIGDPLGWFGRFRLSGGRLDLKRHGLMPLFATARTTALRHRIAARSTADRLRAAERAGVPGSHVIAPLVEAHGIFMDAILRQQLRDLDEGLALSNKVAPAQLSAYQQQQLRWALEQVPRIADLLGTPDIM